jgi:molybdopterin molybdotransferase
MAAGTVVLSAGQRVTPAAIMAAAAAGAATVTVVRRPRVAVVSTGDELVPAGQPLAPGQLPDSNGPGLAAAVRAAGGEVVAIEHARDDVAAVTELLGRLAAIADLVITTGGVSAGAENDPIRAALDGRSDAGFDVRFVAVGMQPGKPQALGRLGRLGRLGSAAYLGFPGNPVSCLVSWAVFGRPLLRRLGGAAEPTPTVAVLGGPVQGLASRQRYVRARLTGGPQPGSAAVATPLVGYGSHLVGGLGATDGFIELPPGDDAYDAGTPVVFLPLEAP